MKMGGQTYFFLVCSPATPGEEKHHGPRNHILPQSGMPRQRINRSGQRSPPLGHGPPLPVHGVSQDVQRHERHSLLSPVRTSAETVSLVVTLMAHGCPLQAIVVAFGYDERTVAGWLARDGIQGQAVQEHLVEQPRALEQMQADEIRVKTHVQGIRLNHTIFAREESPAMS